MLKPFGVSLLGAARSIAHKLPQAGANLSATQQRGAEQSGSARKRVERRGNRCASLALLEALLKVRHLLGESPVGIHQASSDQMLPGSGPLRRNLFFLFLFPPSL